MEFLSLRKIARIFLPALLIATGLVFTSPIKPIFAQERILVAKLNGEAIYLDEVMSLVEKLPAEVRQQPLETYFDRLVDDVVDLAKIPNFSPAFNWVKKFEMK